MEKIRTLFLGTSEFAIPALEGLLELDTIEVVGIVTQPDKPVGRKHEMQFPVIKQHIIDKNIAVDIDQPEKIRKVAKELLVKYKPDLIIVASYGQIIPNSILEYPKYGCLNLHGSILPELRGAVPAQMAILQGLKTTGVTLQKMSEKMDEGDIISVKRFNIPQNFTSEDLLNSLAILAKEIILEDIIKWCRAEIEPIKQDELKVTYCYKEDLEKEKAEVTIDMEAALVERMTRAFYPWPIAWMALSEGVHKGKRLKIFKVELTDINVDASGDTSNGIFKQSGKLFLRLKDGVLELQEVQLEGKNRALGKDSLYLV